MPLTAPPNNPLTKIIICDLILIRQKPYAKEGNSVRTQTGSTLQDYNEMRSIDDALAGLDRLVRVDWPRYLRELPEAAGTTPQETASSLERLAVIDRQHDFDPPEADPQPLEETDNASDTARPQRQGASAKGDQQSHPDHH